MNNLLALTEEQREEYLLELLPHGSGIDCDWTFTHHHNGTKASNSYHLMNEQGVYIGFIDFTITIPFSDPERFRLTFQTNSCGYYQIHKHDLRSYLDETIHYHLFDKAETFTPVSSMSSIYYQIRGKCIL